jgi:hypothetical protein
VRLRLEATPAELWTKGTALVEELAKAFSGVNAELADILEKALPPKEHQLKYPVLQELSDRTTKEYEATLKRMLVDIGKVLDKSLKAPTLRKSGTLFKQEEEEEEKLEPGDVDPETGDLIPEPEDEEEEEEEGEGEEENRLDKAAPGGIERTYRVRGHSEVIDQLDALLLIANKLGQWGASRSVTISMDGDGPHFLEVEGIEMKLPKRALERQIDKDEIKAYQVQLEKALPQSEPLDYDFTKPIAEKDERAYMRVKRVLMNRGYSEEDFLEGGQFYGYSVNRLIDAVREMRKVA